MAQQSEAAKRIVIIGTPTAPRPHPARSPPKKGFSLLIEIALGGGAIGCSAAYFLTRHPHYDRGKYHITLLEATKIAGGASGKAGGFIASWADPPCLASLTWQLHMNLANEYPIIDYNKVPSLPEITI